MTKEIIVRNGFVKFWRVGPVEFGRQKPRWDHRAPEAHGLWAFPWPFFDFFFAAHKYWDVAPKWLDKCETAEEVDEWIRKVGRRVMPIREFWFKGDLYSRVARNPSHKVQDWSLVNATDYARSLRVTGYDRFYQDSEGNGKVASPTSIDHMEVFIAPNRGIIRSSPVKSGKNFLRSN